jgi:hypothetical protein
MGIGSNTLEFQLICLLPKRSRGNFRSVRGLQQQFVAITDRCMSDLVGTACKSRSTALQIQALLM